MESKLLHLQMIQGVINRMANCSFLLRGWSVILVSALFALAAKNAEIVFVVLAYFPAIAFCILDGFYLYQERLFRNLYDKVRQTDAELIDFSMDTRELEGLNKATWIYGIFSRTVLWFHVPLIVAIVVVMLILVKKGG